MNGEQNDETAISPQAIQVPLERMLDELCIAVADHLRQHERLHRLNTLL